ncbi:hypothetical protein INT47_007524 [Mucor saturninus]|uniref:Actin-like ATPase domain-containing protein n=1 Tax=Mucor saturninus TaxID=64648 RepID=A0A8H7R6C2_9FUNG|nr:hypothetical protein INT47_007524 [Mucor saturninus]
MGHFRPEDYDYVVGIDFGTTYSGCSFAYTGAGNREIEDIIRWPNQSQNVYSKTPTVLLYKCGAATTEWWGEYAYKNFWYAKGYLHKKLVTRFKLLLNNDSSVPELPPGLQVEGVIRDYLKGFHKHIMVQLEHSLGSRYNPDKIRYCLTVPAGWSDQAKIIMREATINAGIIKSDDHPERLTLISEPEAAALYCQKNCEEFNLTDGQQFLICDAGGGTVDLVTFEISGDNSDRTLKEITTARGENCGSTFLDCHMRNLLKEKISQHMVLSPITLEEMTKSFVEKHKLMFGEKGERDGIYLEVPSAICDADPAVLEKIGVDDYNMFFSYEELMERVFEPVVSKVIHLIQQQLDHPEARKPMDAIFMVGGFSKSPYLESRIRETFKDRASIISAAPRGELAVVRGAVMLGLQPTIVSQRIAKHTYGIQTRSRFDCNEDPEEYRITGTDLCGNRFHLIVKKNQKLPNNHVVSHNYTISSTNKTAIVIYACDDDNVVPRWVQSTDGVALKQVGKFILSAPANMNGDEIPLKVDFYFGKTEIKIDAHVLETTTTFTLAYANS